MIFVMLFLEFLRKIINCVNSKQEYSEETCMPEKIQNISKTM